MDSSCVSYDVQLFIDQPAKTAGVADESPQQQLRRQLLSTLDLFTKSCYDDRLESFGIKKHHSFNNEMQRREHFGSMLDSLEKVGLDRSVARHELLMMIAGKTSTVLNRFIKL